MIREKYLTIAKGKLSIQPSDPHKDPNSEDLGPQPESTSDQPNIEPELIPSTGGPNNRSNPKQALGRARTKLLAKTAILESYMQTKHLQTTFNQAATAARSTRLTAINPTYVQYTPFNGIKDNDTDSETTVRNHWEGSVPFQQPDDQDILDMSNNESDNALVRMVRYMLDQNIQMTMEKSPLAKAGVKVTPPNKYSGEQSFEALETFVKGLLQWLDMHSMLGPDAYKYQVSFLGMRLEGKALEWFDKTVEPRKYRGTPMDLKQVVTGL
ncbi:hypothetical protein M422DRAFT_264433 [Sphaerobolus stellatus SS14]|uniref:Uncharacterized protein n=1 Tax=Sphaerobolus stellatus (strain SS14) TaxID=990650 RepID=A0A0C9TTA9_SPHS4|nr:hypothetical protein M422DRAFT_264433 [Sphaerobolus stellatus SS14]